MTILYKSVLVRIGRCIVGQTVLPNNPSYRAEEDKEIEIRITQTVMQVPCPSHFWFKRVPPFVPTHLRDRSALL
jgi:hypothetical protein